MLAQLGDVRFELLEGFTSFEQSHKAKFAEHAVLQGKPRLQVMGEELTRLNFDLRLHWKLGNPDVSLRALVAAQKAQEPLDLIFGSGRRVGRFVIESVNETVLEQNAQGKTAARALSVSLLEYAEAQKEQLNLLGVLDLGENPLTAMLPESVQVSVSGALAAAQKGVAVYRQACEVAQRCQDAYDAAKELKNDPAGLLNHLGDVFDSITQSQTDFFEIQGSENVQKIIKTAADVFHQLGDIGATIRHTDEDNALSVLDTIATGIEGANALLNESSVPFQAALTELATRQAP